MTSPTGKLLLSKKEQAHGFLSMYAIRAKRPRCPHNARALQRADIPDDEKIRLASVAWKERHTQVRLKQEVRAYLSEPSPPAHSEPFSFAELIAATAQTPTGGAAGRDGIHNRMLHALSPALLQEILAIANVSWKEGSVPDEWKYSTIVPILKPQKDAHHLLSYRGISLTSVISKLVERMVCNRLLHILESSNSLSDAQYAYRRARSTMDPLLLFTHTIRDGFERRLKTLGILFDLDKAFDCVDHDLLLREFKRKQIPPQYGRWFHAFLCDRKAEVRLGTTVSRARRFQRGVPQGSVSGPLLWLIYFDPLLTAMEKLSRDQDIPLRQGAFSDDYTVWVSGDNIVNLAAYGKEITNVVSKYNSDYRMKAGDSECILFSMNDDDNNNTDINLTVNGSPITRKNTVRLLGLLFDSKLNFKAHAAYLHENVNRRLGQIQAVCGSDWGMWPADRRALFMSYARSKLLYGGAIYWPLLANPYKKKLIVLDNKGQRIITGCTRTTNLLAMHLTSNLLPLDITLETQLATIIEKYRRRATPDAVYSATTGYISWVNRLKKGIAPLKKADNILEGIGIKPARRKRNGKIVDYTYNREPLLIASPIAPWDTGLAHLITSHPYLIDPTSKEDSDEVKKLKALATLETRGAFDIEGWCDGTVQSDEQGVVAGAAAAALYIGQLEPVRVIVPAGFLATSYRAEGLGFRALLEKLIGMKEMVRGKSLLVCTDSQSVVSRLQQGPVLQDEPICATIWALLLRCVSDEIGICKVVIQWIPSHCGLEKNEDVDAAAQAAFECMGEQQKNVGVPFSTLKSVIKQRIKAQWIGDIQHLTTMSVVYDGVLRFLRPNLLDGLDRMGALLISQLRTGHCKYVGKFWHIIHKGDGKCRWCGIGDESVAHLFNECTCGDIVRVKSECGVRNVTDLASTMDEVLKKCVKFVLGASKLLGNA